MVYTLQTRLNMSDIKTSTALDHQSNNFDALRLLAAIAVLFSHCFSLSGIPGIKDPLDRITCDQISFGKLGVMVFFIISGYLIAQSYDHSPSLLRFIKCRFLRVFPGLFAVLVLSAFVIGPLASSLSIGAYFQDSYTYTYLRSVFLYPIQAELPGAFAQNVYKGVINGSLWSIPFEVLYYGMVAALGVFRLHARRSVVLLLVVFSILVDISFQSIFGESDPHLVQMTYYAIVHSALPFCCGMLFYSFRDSVTYKPVYAGSAVFVLYYTAFFGGLYICGSIAGAYLLFYLVFQGPVLTRGIAKYGDFSYGIYLYAFPLQQLVIHLFGGVLDPYLQFAITLPLSFAFAWASWFLVEKPALRLKTISFIPQISAFTRIGWHMGSWHPFWLNVLRLAARWAFPISLIIGLAAMTWFRTYLTPPSRFVFPFRGSEVFFSGGWMPQVEAEKYRWVSGSAELRLCAEKPVFFLVIKGYVPENFKTVNAMRIEVDGETVANCSFVPFREINLSIPCKRSLVSKEIKLKLTFDGATRPGIDSPDIRKLSGLITLVTTE